jgi:hypothetical protein
MHLQELEVRDRTHTALALEMAGRTPVPELPVHQD